MKRMAEAALMPANPEEAKLLELLDPFELRAQERDPRYIHGCCYSRSKFVVQPQQSGASVTALVIAKLDRLSRSAGFGQNLRDGGVKFAAVDWPRIQ